MSKCECCGQELPTMSIEQYKARALPRLEALDRLAEKIDFSISSWKWTPEGDKWQRLMAEQANDEQAAGL